MSKIWNEASKATSAQWIKGDMKSFYSSSLLCVCEILPLFMKREDLSINCCTVLWQLLALHSFLYCSIPADAKADLGQQSLLD